MIHYLPDTSFHSAAIAGIACDAIVAVAITIVIAFFILFISNLLCHIDYPSDIIVP